MEKTQFKKGHTLKCKPMGYERVDTDGYHEIKYAQPNTFKLKHRLIYQWYTNEKLTCDDVILFLDSNTSNFRQDNLIKISRKELAILNKRNFKECPLDLRITLIYQIKLQALILTKENSTMNKKTKTILEILNAAEFAMTTNELYEAMEPSEQGLFDGASAVSKSLNTLKTHRKAVDNGVSEIIKGRSVLTWVITKTGKELLEIENNDPVKSDDNAANEALEQYFETSDGSEFNNADNVDVDDGTGETWGNIDIEASPLQYYDAATDSIRAIIEKLLEKETKQLQIENKTETLEVLNYVKDFFSVVNPEYSKIIANACKYIEAA